MKFLFLGDIVGYSGCYKIKNSLNNIISNCKIDFVVANGENSFDSGVGITIISILEPRAILFISPLGSLTSFKHFKLLIKDFKYLNLLQEIIPMVKFIV